MQIEIIDISHSGSGVGKINGKVIFVLFTDVGEIVEVKNIISNLNGKFSLINKYNQQIITIEIPC